MEAPPGRIDGLGTTRRTGAEAIVNPLFPNHPNQSLSQLQRKARRCLLCSGKATVLAMSNIYATEPPTSGKLILSTSHGDIEVELWSKETPKACRNIVGLALEGYYDDMLWHRIVPGFCIQTGDPTGTGSGGESFYGEPFQDEVNQRIKFNRRGLVAMANPGERDHNESQFFVSR